MEQTNIILIDNDEQYTEIFEEYYKIEAPDLKIIRCFHSGMEALNALKAIDNNSYDFIIADPLLQDITDTSFIDKLSNINPDMIKKMVIMTSTNYGTQYKNFSSENNFNIPSIYKLFVFDKLINVLNVIKANK